MSTNSQQARLTFGFRGFANEGSYWTDNDDGKGEADCVWELPAEYEAAKKQLVSQYAAYLDKQRNPTAYHEYNAVDIPSDADFIDHNY
jgi:hypothetical protein